MTAFVGRIDTDTFPLSNIRSKCRKGVMLPLISADHPSMPGIPGMERGYQRPRPPERCRAGMRPAAGPVDNLADGGLLPGWPPLR
jgi:hypothetical protein